eukprot:TRINITY_DN1053_c0_g1_i2.p1 TRINITY_DN1053_c0_g1~~TRINITY_DN1053_c0_g1_i2.p1  ORF type:complete len:446 (-),score=93.20 TRINITY_DN1053_c0_g1_i2:26-1363(-)
MNWNHLRPDEKNHYDSLYTVADADRDGRIGVQDASAFFSKCNLPQQSLGQIWGLADPTNQGFLNIDGFYVAVRLISIVQNNIEPISFQAAMRPINNLPYPHFVGIVLPAPAGVNPSVNPSVTNVPSSMSTSAIQSPEINTQPTTGDLAISPVEREKFEEIWIKADTDGDGYVTGPQARDLFGRSNLDTVDLGKIWNLSDINKDGKLDKEEFIISMVLINYRLKGKPLPNTLPVSLLPPKSPEQLQLERELTLIPSERAKYEEIFTQADTDNDGYVTGPQARDLLGRSGLPQNDLAKIWILADADSDGKLTNEEFVVAMFLINTKMKGKSIPDILPDHLHPTNLKKSAPSSTVGSPSFGQSSQITSPPTSTGLTLPSSTGLTMPSSTGLTMPSSTGLPTQSTVIPPSFGNTVGIISPPGSGNISNIVSPPVSAGITPPPVLSLIHI